MKRIDENMGRTEGNVEQTGENTQQPGTNSEPGGASYKHACKRCGLGTNSALRLCSQHQKEMYAEKKRKREPGQIEKKEIKKNGSGAKPADQVYFVDFTGFPELKDRLMMLCKRDIRRPEEELLFLIQDAIS